MDHLCQLQFHEYTNTKIQIHKYKYWYISVPGPIGNRWGGRDHGSLMSITLLTPTSLLYTRSLILYTLFFYCPHTKKSWTFITSKCIPWVHTVISTSCPSFDSFWFSCRDFLQFKNDTYHPVALTFVPMIYCEAR